MHGGGRRPIPATRTAAARPCRRACSLAAGTGRAFGRRFRGQSGANTPRGQEAAKASQLELSRGPTASGGGARVPSERREGRGTGDAVPARVREVPTRRHRRRARRPAPGRRPGPHRSTSSRPTASAHPPVHPCRAKEHDDHRPVDRLRPPAVRCHVFHVGDCRAH